MRPARWGHGGGAVAVLTVRRAVVVVTLVPRMRHALGDTGRRDRRISMQSAARRCGSARSCNAGARPPASPIGGSRGWVARFKFNVVAQPRAAQVTSEGLDTCGVTVLQVVQLPVPLPCDKCGLWRHCAGASGVWSRWQWGQESSSSASDSVTVCPPLTSLRLSRFL